MGRKIFNKCDFIKKANEVHNNYYDYSEFIYVKSNVKGIIICPNHGSFLQRSNSHLSGSGCKKCKVGRRHTEQTKEKISLIKKQLCNTKEFRKQMSDINTGRKNALGYRHSEDTKLKMSISRKGISRPWAGQNQSDETKNKLSKSSKQAWNTPEIRKKYHDSLKKTKWIKVRADKGQLELLDKWNKLGFNFEPNYQIKTDLDLFYIDGYDKEKNVVLEYDSKYHNSKLQKEKDLIRQKKIINVLKPKVFWRFDSVNKQFRNILGNYDGK